MWRVEVGGVFEQIVDGVDQRAASYDLFALCLVDDREQMSGKPAPLGTVIASAS